MKSFCGVLIAVLLLSSYVFAQSPSVRFSENYQDAAYIFKGKVVKVEAKRGKDKRVYATYLIDIEHIYKGVD